MKPLTIDELRNLEVGDWVWVITEHYSRYVWIFNTEGECLHYQYSDIENRVLTLSYYDYGTKWLAYKNKEQAESKGEIVNYETKYNALKTAVIDVCYSLDDKAYRNEFYNLRIGSRVQHIEKLANQAEAQLKESRGEK